MFPYLDNSLATNWLQAASVTSTSTPAGIDITSAIGPVGLIIKTVASGSGTLAYQPVMSTDNVTFVNVPADAILAYPTGLQTTLTNTTSAGAEQKVYLKRDELYRYISVTLTVTPSATQTVNILEVHNLAYTSTAV